ncbi:formyltetrahydrofolate deformylase [Campylobacter sp. TTU-622]|uniref:formyltetrahydrofolate deformylase n=1 Tax=Campylobacter TaxID=194 RepID=UPI00190454E7|nr:MULTISPECIES: formyltetrahydrofolate deformylase [Campylobacter]MBK1964063.1 formyltetrahydrofolate deformylase [Campylobacter novaezeelandiae]MBK1971023.1 formyltetrahydrofolate deformylase [Campylobacter sp. TTU_617]MBK1973123.1 formyltetrahydrofolate deformylase [Campylobacter sp. TTU-622]MBK1993248.1 formyltetrahydrofolate deformylase [Campylobacter novaezeelandiae]
MKYILKISTKDQKGLVYKISQILFENNINIIKNDEFVNEEMFFFRGLLEGEFDKEKLLNNLKLIMPCDSFIELYEKRKKDIIIFVTKESHCLGDLLIKHFSNELEANIKAVISNYDILKPLVEKFNIPYHTFSTTDKSKDEQEKEILSCLKNYNFDYLVLAKYMRILSPYFVKCYEEKIINIHHSFLPAFIGANPYKQAYERGVKIIGATAHFVNDCLDEGPIITQDVLPVNHEYTWQEMQKIGRVIEKNVLSKALDLVFEDRVFIYNNKTIVF